MTQTKGASRNASSSQSYSTHLEPADLPEKALPASDALPTLDARSMTTLPTFLLRYRHLTN